ncbi:DNA repair protein XRCC1 [Toxocara canis]|uniref:DNA repair protein XRCC1 n=1 Tax=Toxocara canis TaxID=6265 RepID=A0A0B2W194_TOXCA|nr:DNA repair protein XRCC1 [Toxocara canis]
MPLAKFKCVISASDSEQGFEADNLLVEGRTRTKWKGKAGAATNCVIIQLDREHLIGSIDIGNECSALIEILVAKSCEQQSAYHTLIPSSSLMDPMESRTEKNCNRVRIFTNVDMIPAVFKQKWDLIKVVCSQPFNPNIPYGLAFINVVVEEPQMKRTDETRNLLPKITFKERTEKESDGLMKAGNMFKERHLYQTEKSDEKSNDKIIERKKQHDVNDHEDRSEHVKRGDEEYNEMEHATSSQHSDTEHKKPKRAVAKQKAQDIAANSSAADEERKEISEQKKIAKRSAVERGGKGNERSTESGTPQKKEKVVATSEQKEATTSGTIDVPFTELLNGVKFSLSGYQNPLRGQLRDKARRMGAVYEADWTPSCTHLICAFPNTPKWRQVGSRGIIVSEKWIEMCYMRKKRLPEKNFPVTLQ